MTVVEHSAPSLGVTFASFQALGLGYGLDIARSAESLGFGSFWTAETTGHEAFATLAAVAGTTESLELGTGVIALQLRTPMLAAMGAATVADLGPQPRMLLGVGISSPVVVGRWHGAAYNDAPLATTREYLGLLRDCLSGEVVDHEGRFFHVKGFRLGVRLEKNRPRIVLGALNARMLALAGELADGVLLNYLPAAAVPWCVEQVRAGEAAAGRSAGSCRIYAYVHVGVCDPEQARNSARKDLFSYAVVPSYGRAFAHAGFADEVERIQRAHAARDRQAALAAVSDAMIDAIDICGSGDLVRDAVRAYLDAGVEHAVIMPLPWGEDRRRTIEETLAAVARLSLSPGGPSPDSTPATDAGDTRS